MVLCKFFLQGTCKFGDYCKFEHQLNDNFNSYQNPNSILRQSHFGNPQQQPKPATNPSNVDTNTLVKSVVNDMTVAEKGGQWLLSSYAPFKEKPAFPGFEDHSSEEIRLGYYDALKNGTVEQYKQQVQMLLQQAVIKIKSLQSPSPDIVNVLKNIYNTPPASHCGVYGSTPASTTSAFGSTASSSGVFNQQQSPGFAQQQNSVFAQSNQNIFNRPAQPQNQFGGTSNSIFGGGTPQNQVFKPQNSNSIFGNSPTQAQSGTSTVFQQGSNNFDSIFGAQASKPQASSGSIFTGTQPVSGSIFNKAQLSSGSIFGGQQTKPSVFGSPQQTPAVTNNLLNTSFSNQNTTAFGHGIFSSSPNAPTFVASTPAQNVPQTTNTPSTNAFGGAVDLSVTQSMQKSVFGQQPSIFGQQNTGPAFAQPSTNSFFNQPQSGIVDAKSHSESIFGSSQGTVVSNTPFHQTRQVDESLYSKLEELTEEEVKWFQSDDLDILRIPEKPPTYQMCFQT